MIQPRLWRKLHAEKPSWKATPLSAHNDISQILMSSSNPSSETPSSIRHTWQTLRGLTSISFLNTTALHYLAIGKATWMSGPMKCGQWQVTLHGWGTGKLPKPLPSCGNQMTEPQDWSSLDHRVATGKTADLEHLPDSPKTLRTRSTLLLY